MTFNRIHSFNILSDDCCRNSKLYKAHTHIEKCSFGWGFTHLNCAQLYKLDAACASAFGVLCSTSSLAHIVHKFSQTSCSPYGHLHSSELRAPVYSTKMVSKMAIVILFYSTDSIWMRDFVGISEFLFIRGICVGTCE